MAIKYGFFDAAYDEQTGTYDRQYLSEDMSKLFSVITGNGVFKNEGNALEVIPSGVGMSVIVSTGFAIARGRYINNTEAYTLQLDDASEQDRIDIIVASMSTLQNTRSFELIVKKGTPALSPEAPELTRNEGVYEMCLAKINIPSTATYVTESMVEDTREDESLCGFVSGLGGGAEFIDCTINSGVDAYSSAWLLDVNGNVFQPENKKVYRVITDGLYSNCLYLFNSSTNKYEGVGSYNIEFTQEEALALWNESSYSRLSNIPAPADSVQYTGQHVSPTWLYYDPTKIRIGGATSAISAGNYYASFEPINGYAWSDGTVDVKYVMWTIAKKVIPIPVPLQTIFSYDGTQKSVTFNNLDSNAVSISNASATNIGTYSVTATLNDPLNSVWSDDTYVQRAWEFKITGAQNTVTLSKSSVTFETALDSDTITATSLSGGAISVESTDEGVVHASISNGTITLVPGTSPLKGTASVIVTAAAGSTYDAGVATISVSKDYGAVLVSWADGSDEDIVGMVQAADNGEIDLHDYWEIGQEREFRLAAIPSSGSNEYGSWSVGKAQIEQTCTLVLMDTGHFDLVTPVLGTNGQPRYQCSFVVGLKNALIDTDYINSNTSNTDWSNTQRRAWCNAAFAGAIPQTLIPMFKEFVAGTAKITNASHIIEWNQELFSLFAEKEVIGDAQSPYSNNCFADEKTTLSQIEYYKTQANRIKKAGNNGSAIEFWMRSPANSGTAYYVNALSTGQQWSSKTQQNSYKGIAPFGCI